MVEKKMMIMGLCEGRHKLPDEVDGYIFGKELELDFGKLQDTCHEALKYCHALYLYITGFTPALTVVIDYCVWNNINLVLFHYDKQTGEYVKQPMSRMPWSVMEEYDIR